MFEQTFKNIDDILHKDAGCSSELDYTEQTSWMLFLKYLEDLEHEKSLEAELLGKKYQYILDEKHRWGVGRGTRLYDGKDFFTIFDFVKAHHNFNDPEWDGEPLEVTEPSSRGRSDIRVNEPDSEPYITENTEEEPTTEKIKIKLNDGKTRQIKHISSVMYWSPEGKPITAREFVERMFDDLPQFFKDEDELRAIWQNPDTREKLLNELSNAGYDHDRLSSMQRLIDAENSDIYDVLAYIAYNADIKTRVERTEIAKPLIKSHFTEDKQRDFIDFILSKYIEDGVDELSPNKMRTLLELKYHTVSDAAALFGSPAKIRETFVNFQKYLYQSNHDMRTK